MPFGASEGRFGGVPTARRALRRPTGPAGPGARGLRSAQELRGMAGAGAHRVPPALVVLVPA